MTKKIALRKKPLIVGMVHFGPLAGRPDAPRPQVVLQKAKKDLAALIKGGIDAVMFENMYDQPHTERLDPKRAVQFERLVISLAKNLRVPFGLSVLWNDYGTGFAVAKKTGASWIRVPVFVDSVQTEYGIFRAHPKDVIQARNKAGANKVQIFADVHVKHAKLLNKKNIIISARETMKAGADAVILTGKWTGDPPKIQEIKNVRKAIGLFPIFIGSGMTAQNIKKYLPFIDGAIVGTSLKKNGKIKVGHHLQTAWKQQINIVNVRRFMQKIDRIN